METGNIVKPASLAYEDYTNELVRITNESGLPLFVVELVIKEFLIDVRQAAQRQLQADKEEYNKQLSDMNDKEESKTPDSSAQEIATGENESE